MELNSEEIEDQLVPAYDTMNQLLSNDAFNALDFWGKEMNDVNKKLRETTSFEEMKFIIEKFLLNHVNKLNPALPIDEVLQLLIRQCGLIKIEELASQYAHKAFHNTIFKTTVMKKKSVAIRFVTKEVNCPRCVTYKWW